MPTTAPTCARCTRERAFTLVEMIAVMAVMLVLIGLAIAFLRGAKTTTYARETQSAASAYLQAISSYQSDHARRLPPTTGDPATSWGPANAARGPLNLLGKPYVTSPPAGVLNGRIGISLAQPANCSGTAAPAGATEGNRGFLAICYTASDAFARAQWRSAGDPNVWETCFTGAAAPTPRC